MKTKIFAMLFIFLIPILALTACGTTPDEPIPAPEPEITQEAPEAPPEEETPDGIREYTNGSTSEENDDEAYYYTLSPTQAYNHETTANPPPPQPYYSLPPPVLYGDMSVEEALYNRRSRRNFVDTPLSMEQLSQLLWAAYGITLPLPNGPRGGLRTTPSAGASFPLEVYVVVGNVHGLSPGIFLYNSEEHTLIRLSYDDVRQELSDIALGQRMVADAPVTIFYTSFMYRITGRYGDRGIRYAYMELGHSAQNVYLQAEALGLGTVAIGAFDDGRIRALFGLHQGEEPLYLMPVGYFY